MTSEKHFKKLQTGEKKEIDHNNLAYETSKQMPQYITVKGFIEDFICSQQNGIIYAAKKKVYEGLVYSY